MKIAFILDSAFSILSAFNKQISDAESATTYLVIELARLGHDITLFTDSAHSISYFNVRCRRISIRNKELHIDKAILEKDFDALIFKNTTPEFLISLRHALPYKAKMYLWTSYDKGDIRNAGLSNPDIVAEIAGIICVSDYQRDRILSVTDIPHNKIFTMQYAIAPFYQNLFIDGKEFLQEKSINPSLVYIDRSFNGMQLLLNTYEDVEKNYPDSSLTIYSGLHKYGKKEDKIENHFEISKTINNLQQVGAISPIQLASELRHKTILTFPTTEARTYNVQILEAMAAGVYVLTSNAGALSQYGHHLSKNISLDELEAEDLNGYNSQSLTICQTQVHSSQAFFDYCFKQQIEINQKHTWRVRARELLAILTANK